MRLDFLVDPTLVARWAVVDADSGEEIQDVAWADPESGIYATIKKRPRTMGDPSGIDLRIRSDNGNFALAIHRGQIELVDRYANPLKAEFLALLDDPDVIAKIKMLAQRSS
jgi:hypothetical protein